MYEYEVYETLQEIDAELELEQEYMLFGKPTREERRQQLLAAGHAAASPIRGRRLVRGFCDFYSKVIAEYPDLAFVPGIRGYHYDLCLKVPKVWPPPKRVIRRR